MNEHFRPQQDRPDIARHEGLHCPQCGQYLDAVANIRDEDDPVPVDGDYSFCWGCGKPNVFVVGALGVSLRKVTVDELALFYAENQALVQHWRTVAGT